MADELDFEEFWEDVRPRPSLVVVTDRVTDLKSQLLIASEKAGFDLAAKFQRFQGELLTPDLITQIISEGVKVFMEKWFEGLRNRDLSGLLEIVLESKKLTPEELQAFVRALPESLVHRIVESAMASGTGIHALMALELHRRANGLPEYRMEVSAGDVYVKFQTSDGREVVFALYENFKLDNPTSQEVVNT